MITDNIKHDLEKIVYSKNFNTADYTQSFMAMTYFTKLLNSDVFIWGLGKDTLGLVKLLYNENIHPEYIISDRYEKRCESLLEKFYLSSDKIISCFHKSAQSPYTLPSDFNRLDECSDSLGGL